MYIYKSWRYFFAYHLFQILKKVYLQILKNLAQFIRLFPSPNIKKSIFTYTDAIIFAFLPFKYQIKVYLQILKNLAQFFAYSFFKILQISNNTTFYTNNNLHKNHHKYKAKYITTTCIPEITTKNFLLFFFTVYKNEKKKTWILTIKNQKKWLL